VYPYTAAGPTASFKTNYRVGVTLQNKLLPSGSVEPLSSLEVGQSPRNDTYVAVKMFLPSQTGTLYVWTKSIKFNAHEAFSSIREPVSV